MSFADQNIKTSSRFLKIDSGEPKIIRILDKDPFELMIHTKAPPDKPVECKGNGCSECDDGSVPRQRFRINVFDHDASRVMLFEYGTMIAKKLKAIAKTLEEEKQSINDVDLKIEASGSNMGKKYEVMARITPKPVPEGLKLFPLDLPF